MDSRPLALLVYKRSILIEPLEVPLMDLGLTTATCRSLRQAAMLIHKLNPELIFSEPFLADGSWLDLVKLVRQSPSPANVFVVGRDPDSQLHFAVHNSGGFGYLAPPFEWLPFASAVHAALRDFRSRQPSLVPGNAAEIPRRQPNSLGLGTPR